MGIKKVNEKSDAETETDLIGILTNIMWGGKKHEKELS
jgi:hypothetical protein